MSIPLFKSTNSDAIYTNSLRDFVLLMKSITKSINNSSQDASILTWHNSFDYNLSPIVWFVKSPLSVLTTKRPMLLSMLQTQLLCFSAITKLSIVFTLLSKRLPITIKILYIINNKFKSSSGSFYFLTKFKNIPKSRNPNNPLLIST